MALFGLGKMTLGSLFKKPETLLYPLKTKEPPAGLKGHVSNDPDGCILCGICMKVCSTNCIVVDKKERVWIIDRFQCVQCGHCVRECPKKSLTMEPTYEPVAFEKSVYTLQVPEKPKPERKQPAVVAEP